ncbi:MAG: hypothetical protein LBR57_01545 [Alistipes sp.]|jgi:hypothetical protein|nr:hypothetical protein [Alistipes sp.]
MKKVLFLFIAVALSVGVSAQESAPSVKTGRSFHEINPRKGYTNFSYSTQTLSSHNGAEIGKSKYGGSFLRGRTFNMHRKPIADLLYIGLDATWMDFNFTYYEKHNLSHDKPLNQFDVSMGIGPSVNVYPFRKLGVHAYFRYNPTFSFFYMDTPKHEDHADDAGFDVMGGYGSLMVSGLSVSWGAISLGAEARWGAGKYESYYGEFLPSLIDAIGGETGLDKDAIRKLKLSGARYYLSLRF